MRDLNNVFTVKQIRDGYNSDTIEVFLIGDMGTFLNIVPRIDVNVGDQVEVEFYTNLYSTHVESIKRV